MALTFLTLAEFQSRVSTTGSTDATCTSILNSVESSIRTYLQFDPTATALTEYYDTWATTRISLNRWPVSSVDHVYLDESGNYGQTSGAFASTTELTQGTDYDWVQDQGTHAGILYRINQLWPFWYERGVNDLGNTRGRCPGCLKVTYTIDNTDILYVAKEAGYAESTARYRSILTGMGAVSSDSLDGASVSVSSSQRNSRAKDPADTFMSPIVADMLRSYRINRFI